jgi:nitronate monooxygenase
MGLAWTSCDDASKLVTQAKGLTDKPFFVNFALAFEPKGLPAVLDAGAPIIAFSWGDPSVHIPLVHEFGAKVGVQVGNMEGAKRARDIGADFIICQGMEAGGHVQATESLMMWISDAIKECAPVPVVAAGGISTGEDIARFMRLGAQGAMLGTRFVATQESRAHEEYKRQLVGAKYGDTALTVCFNGGWPHAPHRVLRNSTLNAWEAAGCPQPGSRPGEGQTVACSTNGEPIPRYEDTAPRIGMTGDVEAMALYAGQGVGQVTDVPKAGELVRRLWKEAQAYLT